MIIIVKTARGSIITRPETGWERNGTDFYPQEFISAVACTPALYLRISRSGRSIARRFAGRYFDTIGYGALLYPEDMLDGSPESIACASCIDHSSYLAGPAYDRSELGQKEKHFLLECDGKTVFDYCGAGADMLETAIEEASARIHVRTGDLLAIELAEPIHLSNRPSTTRLKGSYGNDCLFDFNIIMNLL